MCSLPTLNQSMLTDIEYRCDLSKRLRDFVAARTRAHAVTAFTTLLVAMRQCIANRAIWMLASGPFRSHFFSTLILSVVTENQSSCVWLSHFYLANV
ncbi:hypothetical protein KIN20_030328 [Parelaphostrongylus tenuis]|uniref:Uncharacterized protein n=1 Tax=Parelaphostrongylus tenuis TaxID=148309 RepID=A0AAD5WG87_PARTN|nr:hypothetical protein KIN20_030328 [Parelaphostrongylus tenuis]